LRAAALAGHPTVSQVCVRPRERNAGRVRVFTAGHLVG
jgi:hypothetical protein